MKKNIKISEKSKKVRANNAREADPEEVLSSEDDQKKIEVLFYQMGNKQVAEWLRLRIQKWRKKYISDHEGYDTEDIEQRLWMDLSHKTFPRFIESGKKMENIEGYIMRAIKHLCTDYIREIKNSQLDDSSISSVPWEALGTFPLRDRLRRMDIRLLPLSEQMHQILSCRADLFTQEDIAELIGTSKKTIQRKEDELRTSNYLRELLEEDSKGKI
jgi:DNA-directed RNA polymerase specialized sigma24 family protein